MGAKRLQMRKLREILRLKYERRMRHRAIARACGVGVGTVSDYVRRAHQEGLDWPLPPNLDDQSLEAKLFALAEPDRERVQPGDRGQRSPWRQHLTDWRQRPAAGGLASPDTRRPNERRR